MQLIKQDFKQWQNDNEVFKQTSRMCVTEAVRVILENDNLYIYMLIFYSHFCAHIRLTGQVTSKDSKT